MIAIDGSPTIGSAPSVVNRALQTRSSAKGSGKRGWVAGIFVSPRLTFASPLLGPYILKALAPFGTYHGLLGVTSASSRNRIPPEKRDSRKVSYFEKLWRSELSGFGITAGRVDRVFAH